MKNKKASHLLAFMAAAMAISDQYVPQNNGNTPKVKKVKKPQKGHREFFYGENSVWALNQANADRKAEKLGYNVLLKWL